MVWEPSGTMDERVKFVAACLAGEESMTALCARYSISRKTGYKWLARYRERGVEGLVDRPRRPLHHGRATDQQVVMRILAVKAAHPAWGARRILAQLRQADPDRAWPAASTIAEIVKRASLKEPSDLMG